MFNNGNIKKRFWKEIDFINEELLDKTEILDIDEENLSLTIGLKGPKGKKYENNIYEVNFSCPKGDPFEQPKIVFKTPIHFFDDDDLFYMVNTKLVSCKNSSL